MSGSEAMLAEAVAASVPPTWWSWALGVYQYGCVGSAECAEHRVEAVNPRRPSVARRAAGAPLLRRRAEDGAVVRPGGAHLSARYRNKYKCEYMVPKLKKQCDRQRREDFNARRTSRWSATTAASSSCRPRSAAVGGDPRAASRPSSSDQRRRRRRRGRARRAGERRGGRVLLSRAPRAPPPSAKHLRRCERVGSDAVLGAARLLRRAENARPATPPRRTDVSPPHDRRRSSRSASASSYSTLRLVETGARARAAAEAAAPPTARRTTLL